MVLPGVLTTGIAAATARKGRGCSGPAPARPH
jgi:hypothetical protein